MSQGKLLIGLKTSDIVEIDEKASDSQPMSLVFGHGEGQLWALSPHPTEPMFATGSYDRNLVVWSISTQVSIILFSCINLVLFCTDKSNFILIKKRIHASMV